MIGRGGRGTGNVLAHRLAWELENGPVPDGMYVCHSCDRPSCCNPAHLFLGSQRENMADMAVKGRANSVPPVRRGSELSRKLAEADVAEIRRLHAAGLSQREIGSRYGIGQMTVSDIITRRSWKHVP